MRLSRIHRSIKASLPLQGGREAGSWDGNVYVRKVGGPAAADGDLRDLPNTGSELLKTRGLFPNPVLRATVLTGSTDTPLSPPPAQGEAERGATQWRQRAAMGKGRVWALLAKAEMREI